MLFPNQESHQTKLCLVIIFTLHLFQPNFSLTSDTPFAPEAKSAFTPPTL